MSEPRWGMTLPLPGLGLAEHERIVRELPGLRYTDVWTSETAGVDAFTPLSLSALWAPELRLGTAIVPVYTRGPGLLAQSAATVAELAPGRFTLGIGASAPAIVAGWNATAFVEPFARVRDTLRFLRSALSGEKVTQEYPTFAVSKFKLENVPATPPRIMLAALRPGMLRLAGAEADGAITNWLAASDVVRVRDVVGPKVELAARIFVYPSEDTEAARKMGRFLISSYLTVPAYAAFHEWLGRSGVFAEMHARWQAGDRKGANAAIPDEVVDALVVHGSPASCRAQVAEYVRNGLDTPVIAMLPTGEDPVGLVRALAPQRGAP
jgi:probable F420-dependent oxidoreductase